MPRIIDFTQELHGFDPHLQLLQHERCLGTLGVTARVGCFEAVELDHIPWSHCYSRVPLGGQRGARHSALPEEHAHAIDAALYNAHERMKCNKKARKIELEKDSNTMYNAIAIRAI